MIHSSDDDAQAGSGDLFGDEPKANSPEDLGQVTPVRGREKPLKHPFGDPTPAPDTLPTNASSHALTVPNLRKFVDWVRDQDIAVHRDVTVGHCVTAFSGLDLPDLKWLCRAVRQAKRAPRPTTMKKAAVARDVRILRPGGDPDRVIETI